ncbi:rod-binding protein [Planctomicrobium sp. SH527]|uniref:rod-binding protein n=1 Tax=Planctomicrobium sp. SH527 TaxID=3448123 RepID=UPI003F5B2C7A
MNAISSTAASLPISLMSDPMQGPVSQQPEALAKQFESLFVSMLVKEMRQSSGSEDGLFPGDSSDTYGGMFDMFMGQHIAENGGIGMAESIREAVLKQGSYGR